MPFIGIIAKESDSNFIKNEINKNAEKNKFEIINLNEESIKNIKNIKFETIIVNDDISNLLKKSFYLENIIKNSKYLLINSDIIKDAQLFESYNNKIITYGLNQKALVTISSINNENILICLQEDMEDNEGKIVYQQENCIEITKNNLKKVCNSLAIFSVLLIYGEKLEKI